MENLELTETQMREVSQKRYDNVIWSQSELFFHKRYSCREKLLEDKIIPVSRALDYKLRASAFGAFLNCFNPTHNQDLFVNENKLGILQSDLKKLSEVGKQHFDRRNNIFDDTLEVLENYVKYKEVLDCKQLYISTPCLRITNLHVNAIDDGLLKFRNLRVLVLTGNWIEDFDGSCLPRQLKYLELFTNEIKSVENLVAGAPQGLVHIGLGRNKLTNDSQLHMICHGKFPKLRSLDVADNDIYCLESLLEALQDLRLLITLQLEGNPCYVNPRYKASVLSEFPQLLYLDCAEVLESDHVTDNTQTSASPGLIFKCFRVIGLPPPPKQKNVKQTFHMELKLPLLEEIDLEPELEENQQTVDDGKKNKTKAKKGKGSAKSPKNTKKSKKSKKKGKQVIYDVKENEYNEFLERKLKNRIRTERMPWSKMLEFPTLNLLPPNNDMNLLRDTLRSNVEIKLIYFMWQPPVKIKKGKGRGKANKKDKKSKKKGKHSSESTEKPDVKPEEPKETILKKITVAHFNCDLYTANWSDETIDFYWAEHKDLTSCAIPVQGTLKAITYSDAKKKDKKNKGKQDEEASQKIENVTDGPKGTNVIRLQLPLPREFTCQVGFGLIRDHFS